MRDMLYWYGFAAGTLWGWMSLILTVLLMTRKM
jgi:hypothetical protein